MILIFFLVSCSKQRKGDSEPSPLTGGLWEWYRTDGFFEVATPQSTGKYWNLAFNADSTLLNTGNYMVQVMPDAFGTYNLNTGTLIPSLGYGTYVTVRSPNMTPWRLKYSFISNDTLALDSGSPFDAPVFYFARRRM